jgi:hypothetical protein
LLQNFINPDVTLSRHEVMRSPQIAAVSQSLLVGGTTIGTYSAFRNTAHEVCKRAYTPAHICVQTGAAFIAGSNVSMQ